MKVLGYDIDPETRHSECGTVWVGRPEDQLMPPHKWGDGTRGRWMIVIKTNRVNASGDTQEDAEADAVEQLNKVASKCAEVLQKHKAAQEEKQS